MDLSPTETNLTNATFLAKMVDPNAHDYTIAKEKNFLEESYKF